MRCSHTLREIASESPLSLLQRWISVRDSRNSSASERSLFARLLCCAGCPHEASKLVQPNASGGAEGTWELVHRLQKQAKGAFSPRDIYFTDAPGPLAEYAHPEVTVADTANRGRGICVKRDIKAGTLLISSPAIAYEGTNAFECGAAQQVHTASGLACRVHRVTEESAITRLKLRSMFGSGEQRAEQADAQLFRSFRSSADLLAVEAAAQVTQDRIPFEDVQRIVQHCSWAGDKESMWEGDPIVHAQDPSATAWQAAFLPWILSAPGDAVAATVQRTVEAWRARSDDLRSAKAFHMLFGLPSFLNHSSTTNVSLVLVGSTLLVRAARDLDEGEELLCNYFNVASPLAVRREAERALGFEEAGERAALEAHPDVPEVHTAMMDLYRRLQKQADRVVDGKVAAGGAEAGADDEEHEGRLKVLQDAYTQLLELMAKHERLHQELRLQPHQRSWLRASVLACYSFMLVKLTTVELDEPAAMQLALTIEAALRRTMPGSVRHVAAAVQLLHLAQELKPDSVEYAAAARLCRLAIVARYGDVDVLYPRIIDAYRDAELSPF